jgi:hypothetical protein
VTGTSIDLARVCDSVSIPGAFVGTVVGAVTWRGKGVTIEEFERNWVLDMRGESAGLTLQPGRFPLAREVKEALERMLGESSTGGQVASKPATLNVSLRRGRLTLDGVSFEFDNGLQIGMRGRAELDGRIAGWITVARLPKPTGPGDPKKRSALQRLVDKDSLRFAITGSWARPSVDVQGLMWLLPDGKTEARDGE